jgi:anti-sigma regulatory factor (Ser/Thr protein kinase)
MSAGFLSLGALGSRWCCARGAVMGLAGAGSVFSHDVLMHDSDDQLLDTVVPFLRVGLDAGESAVVCCTPPTAGLLHREVGQDPRVAFLDYDATYSTPIGAIAAYQEIVDSCVAAGAHQVRVIGEATSNGCVDDRLDWARYEAVANRALEQYPLSAICTYDRRALPPDVLAYGRLTHPMLVDRDRRRGNPDFVDPGDFLRRTARNQPEPEESGEPDLEVASLGTLDDLRERVEECLLRTTHMTQEAADLLLAVNELATNAMRHGEPPVSVRLWVRPDRLVCTVTDHGLGVSDPFAGYIWPGAHGRMPVRGMGMWVVRRLCDRLDLVTTPTGFTVRLVIERGHTTPHPGWHPEPPVR